MKKTQLSKGLALTLCAGLLLSLCGCDEGGDKPSTTTTTVQATTATTPSTTTTTAQATAATTPSITTTATEVTTTEATAATTATTAPTTQAPAATDLQIGGSTFTQDGVTFEMGTSPEKLLAHLGQPNKINRMGDSQIDATATEYHYDDLIVITITPTGTTDEIVAEVYFISNGYSFDGIAVGDTAKKLDQTISSLLAPTVRCNFRQGFIGGPSYWYDKDENDLVQWLIFFPKDDATVEVFYENQEHVPSDTKITCIKVKYLYEGYRSAE